LANVNELNEKLSRVKMELQQAIDLSVEIRHNNPQVKPEITHIWEEFLGHFLGYIKKRGKETRENLLADISWTRIRL